MKTTIGLRNSFFTKCRLFTTILGDARLSPGSVNFAQPEKSMMHPTALAACAPGQAFLLAALRQGLRMTLR